MEIFAAFIVMPIPWLDIIALFFVLKYPSLFAKIRFKGISFIKAQAKSAKDLWKIFILHSLSTHFLKKELGI